MNLNVGKTEIEILKQAFMDGPFPSKTLKIMATISSIFVFS